ncbi:hypothetical protein [Nonomuraea sp. NPDC050310]|uniref:hypothetical protein n=1 Tax=Nonomuraea sp. NPDC050310 TaxID=3154935 RepID=UPI0033EA54F1
MAKSTRPLPADDQWELLSSHGFSEGFAGTWLEGDDVEAVARQLRADLSSRLDCDLQAALDWYDPLSFEEVVWVGEHAPGWLHIIGLQGPGVVPAPLSAEGRRLFFLEYNFEGVQGLSYWRDGQNRGQMGRNANFGGELEDVFAEHEVSPTRGGSEQEEMNDYLLLLGRVTGRFIDQDWFTGQRALFGIPKGAWKW